MVLLAKKNKSAARTWQYEEREPEEGCRNCNTTRRRTTPTSSVAKKKTGESQISITLSELINTPEGFLENFWGRLVNPPSCSSEFTEPESCWPGLQRKVSFFSSSFFRLLCNHDKEEPKGMRREFNIFRLRSVFKLLFMMMRIQRTSGF